VTQNGLDLGDLNALAPSSYIKIDGKWYYVADCSITVATANYSHVRKGFEPTGPDQIDLRLHPAPWKED